MDDGAQTLDDLEFTDNTNSETVTNSVDFNAISDNSDNAANKNNDDNRDLISDADSSTLCGESDGDSKATSQPAAREISLTTDNSPTTEVNLCLARPSMDMWSLGALFFHILTGQSILLPSDDSANREVW
jgi:hypothetical protein